MLRKTIKPRIEFLLPLIPFARTGARSWAGDAEVARVSVSRCRLKNWSSCAWASKPASTSGLRFRVTVTTSSVLEFSVKLSYRHPRVWSTRLSGSRRSAQSFRGGKSAQQLMEASRPKEHAGSPGRMVRSASGASKRCRRERRSPSFSNIHWQGPRRSHRPSCIGHPPRR